VAALYQAVGAAILQCQNFENRLAEFMVVVYDHQPDMTLEQAQERVADLSEKTLGQLIKELGKRASIEQILKELLGERNWLAHRLQRENGLDTFHADRFEQVIRRIEDVSTRAMHLQREFIRLGTDRVCRKTGMTIAEFEAGQAEVVKQMIASGRSPVSPPRP
jgi:hypothetical protein